MLTPQEAVKERVGNPFLIREKLEAAAREGFTSLTQDDQFLAKWYGLYTHRHEPGFFMLRLKIPNGFVSCEQLRAVARIAQEQNKGFADITTRQDFQLHWVHAKDAPHILEELDRMGITTLGACGDIMRNLVGCPVAGVDKGEYFDASAVLLEVHRYFTGNPDFANLPRKYKVSIAACREQCQQPEIQCVSFVGIERERNAVREIGFDLRLGGGLSTRPYYGERANAFVEPQQVLPVLKAITEIYRDAQEYRSTRARARFKFLIADWGVAKFRQALQERIDFPLKETGPLEDPQDNYKDHVGVHEEKEEGFFYVGIPVLVGRIDHRQMRKVADLSERYGSGKIRLTVRQNLLILHVPQENVAPILEGLNSVGLSVNASPIMRGVLACTGIEFCKLAVTETKARAREIVEHLEKRVLLDEPLRIHVTGCPNACAQSSIAHIGLQGSRARVEGQDVETYDVAVGGELGRHRAFNHFVTRKIPAHEVTIRLEQLLLGYKRLRQTGEGFNDFCRRIGDSGVSELLAPAQGS